MARSHWGLCSICPLVMGLFLISGLPWLTWKTFRNHFHLSHINRLWLQWVKCPHGQRQGWKGWHYKTWNWVLSPVFFPLYLNHSLDCRIRQKSPNWHLLSCPLVPLHPENTHSSPCLYFSLWKRCSALLHTAYFLSNVLASNHFSSSDFGKKYQLKEVDCNL